MSMKSYYSVLFFVLLSPSAMFAAEGEGGFPQLDITTYPSQVFWLVLTFGFLYIVVFSYFSPRLHKIAKNRNNYLSSIFKKLVKCRDSLSEVEKKINQENALKSQSIEDMNLKLKTNLKNHLEQETKLLEDDYQQKYKSLVKEQEGILNERKGKFSESISSITEDILAKLDIQVNKEHVEEFAKKETETYINKTTAK